MPGPMLTLLRVEGAPALAPVYACRPELGPAGLCENTDRSLRVSCSDVYGFCKKETPCSGTPCASTVPSV